MSTLTPLDPPPSYEDAQRPPQGSNQTGPLASPRGPPPIGRPRPPFPLQLPALLSLRGKRVILASKSPRRRELLAQIGLVNLEIRPSTFAEDLPKTLSPFEYVLQTATEKILDVYRKEIDNEEKGEPALIIAADTIVVSHNGSILEKPKSEADHVGMLSMLRDEGMHKVYTAVAMMRPLESAKDPGYALETHVEETAVKFDRRVTDDLILSYVKTRDGADKAGGYGIQTAGAILIEKIEGSYDNVVGLPLCRTLQLIEKIMRPEEELEDEFERSDDEDLI
ncbi:Maf-domain-containing protein [Polyplosphaeria fusca]|uniref:Maf-domain-containing protein n=1 Tax=Polyplosphaeria fusca TaxID=682080 RepID=A0A9P4V6A4_9PLEO|nr:Maf-domain-containing protein [Polyplosphaeria fusca]